MIRALIIVSILLFSWLSLASKNLVDLFESQNSYCNHLDFSLENLKNNGSLKRQSVRTWRSLYEGLQKAEHASDCQPKSSKPMNIEFRLYMGQKNKINLKVFVGAMGERPIELQEQWSQETLKPVQNDMIANQLKVNKLNHQYIFDATKYLSHTSTIYNLILDKNEKFSVLYCRNPKVWMEKLFQQFSKISRDSLQKNKKFEIQILDNPCGQDVESFESKILVLKKSGRHALVTQTFVGQFDRTTSLLQFDLKGQKELAGKKLLLVFEDVSSSRAFKTRVAYLYLAEKLLSP